MAKKKKSRVRRAVELFKAPAKKAQRPIATRARAAARRSQREGGKR